MGKFSVVLATVGLLAATSFANKHNEDYQRMHQRRQADMFGFMPFPPPPMGGAGGGVTINVGGGGCCDCSCPVLAPAPPPAPAPGPPPPPAPAIGPPPAPASVPPQPLAPGSTPDPWGQTTTDSWNVGTTGWMQPAATTAAAAGSLDMPIACPTDNDLLLVIDESSSIGPSNFQIVQDFAARLAEVWRSHPGNRVSVIFFENKARMYITLKESESLDGPTIRQKILSSNYGKGGTQIAAGLDAATQELKTQGRLIEPRNVVVFTDGRSYFPDPTVTAATNMFSTGSSVNGFAVAVGNNTNDMELMAVAKQDASHIFKEEDFSQLLPILKSLSETICTATQTGGGIGK